MGRRMTGSQCPSPRPGLQWGFGIATRAGENVRTLVMLDRTKGGWMRRSVLTCLICAVISPLPRHAGYAGEQEAPKPRIKKLIEFGWDEPDTAFLRRHIAE